MDPQTTQPDSQSNPTQVPVQQTNLQPEQVNKKSPNYILIALAIILLFIFIGLVGYIAYLYGKDAEKEETEDEINETSISTSTKTTTETTAEEDPYEGWNTYTNDLIGYTVRYPKNYSLDFDDERCVQIGKGNITINIGRNSTEEEFATDFLGCFRTGMGAYEVDKTNVAYTINGEAVTIEEWYEKAEQEDGTFGNIYAIKFLDTLNIGVKWGIEYYGHPKDTFEEERPIVTKIIESISW